MIRLLGFFLLLTISGSLFGNESIDDIKNPSLINYNNFKYSSTEEVMSDKFNQFLYSIMGKDSLISSLPFNTSDSIIEEIKSLNSEDLVKYEFIFMPEIGNTKSKSGYSIPVVFVEITKWLGVFILVLFFIWNTISNLISGQLSGSFMGSNFITGKFAQRFAIASLLLISVNQMPIAYYLFLKSMGYSNVVAHKIHDYLVDSSVTINPTIRYPNFDSKTGSARELLQFGVCLYSEGVTEEQAGNIRIPFTADDYNYKTSTTVYGCNLELSFSLDEIMINDFNSSESLKDLNLNPVDIQLGAISSALTNAIQNSLNYGKKITEGYEKIKGVYNNNIIEAFSDASNKVDVEFSRESCSNLGSKVINDASDFSDFINLSTVCISDDLVTGLAYSKSFPYSDIFYNNPLSSGVTQVCKSAGDVGNSVSYISSSGSLLGDENTNSVDLKTCVINECSGGSLYQCGVAANLLSQNDIKTQKKESGWLYAGVSIFNAFSVADISEGAKKPLNSISATSSKYIDISYGDVVGKDSTGGSFVLDLNLSPLSVGNIDNTSSYDGFAAINFITYSNYLSPDSLNKYITEFANFGSFGDAGILGSKEFFECIKNPLSITDDFYCGTTTDEMVKFGKNVYRFMLTYYSYRAITTLGTKIKKNRDDDDMGGYGASSSSSLMLNKVGSALNTAGIVGLTPYFMYISDFSGGNDAYMPQSNFSNQIALSAIIPIISASVSSDTALGSFVGFTMKTLTFLCFVALIIVPLMPFALFFAAIINFFYRFFITIVFLCAWIATMMSANENSATSMASRGLLMILQLVMIPPLYITGLIIAWFIAGDLISTVITHSDVFSSLAVDSSQYVTAIIDTVIGMLFYIIILYIIYTMVFSIIEGLHQMATEWILGNLSLTAFGKNRANSWENYSGFGSMLASKFK